MIVNVEFFDLPEVEVDASADDVLRFELRSLERELRTLLAESGGEVTGEIEQVREEIRDVKASRRELAGR